MKSIFYGLGNLSYSIIGQTISSLFMFYATSILDMKGYLVGIAIAISTIWDGLSDTIVGYFSDNYPILKMGKRNGYMCIASIGMSICNILIWCVPNDISMGIKFIWIIVSLLLIETFNTMFSTPYVALGNELAVSNNDRTKINAMSTIFFLIGIIVPSLLMYIFLPNTDEYPIGQLNPRGYIYIAIVTSIICFFTGIISSIFTIEKSFKSVHKTKNRFKFSKLFKNFINAFKNKKIRNLVLGYMCTSISTVFLCSIGMHFFTYSLFYSTNQITIILLTLLIGNILSQFFWFKVSKKLNKKRALLIGMFLTIISIFIIILIYIFRIELFEISFYLMIVSIFFCGIGSGALYSLPTSIYGDEIMRNKVFSNKVATYSSVLTFSANLANSITQLIIGILLDVINFDSSLDIQTLKVQTGIALILFIGIETSLIIAFWIFNRIKIRNDESEIHKFNQTS